jgi:ribosome maturation factor RimP
LRTAAHFAQVVGQVVKIRTVRSLDGRRRFKGLLRAADAAQLQVEVDGKVTGIPLELVEKANLVPEV